MSKNCFVCGSIIPEGRIKALPNVQTCISHSSAEKKVGISVSYGQGDHTYVELNIMEAEDYKRMNSHIKRAGE